MISHYDELVWTGLCLAGKIFDTVGGYMGAADHKGGGVTNVMQWPEQNRILSIETPAGRENGFS